MEYVSSLYKWYLRQFTVKAKTKWILTPTKWTQATICLIHIIYQNNATNELFFIAFQALRELLVLTECSSQFAQEQ